MYWNHRVIKKEYKNEFGEIEQSFAIHECYYDEESKFSNVYTKDPIEAEASSIEDLRWLLEKMIKCLDFPVIEVNDDIERNEIIEKELKLDVPPI